MTDPRIEVLAKSLVNYSCELKKGEKLLIEATGIDYPLINAIIKEVYAVGGLPFVQLSDQRINREIMMGTSKEHCDLMAKYAMVRMDEMQAYIGIRGGNNSYELSDVTSDKTELYNKYYSHPVHHGIRVPKTKWVILRYPNPSMAQLAGWSTEKFEDFYFNVCNLDYAKMARAMTPLVTLMDKTDKVRLVAKDTDISFSIKDIPTIKCKGDRNIPDGEVYTAPVKDSVNGVITYNAPSIHDGIKHENIRLEFKNGKIVNAEGNFTRKLNEVLDTDEGARYIGEFAIGVNPYITEPMGDILFDEKISGSIHFTPGAAYDEAFNGNKSAVHWDLVLIQTPEYGGGEIWFDGKLVRKDGCFVLPELECLNPEALK